MIDYYENVDFDQKVWVFEDGGGWSSRCCVTCAPTTGTTTASTGLKAAICLNIEPNYQLPRRVLQSFDTEAEAEHAYWLLLLHNVTTTDTALDLLWTSEDAIEAVADKIRWAEENVRYRVRYSEGNTEWANSDGYGEKVAYWIAQLEQLEAAR